MPDLKIKTNPRLVKSGQEKAMFIVEMWRVQMDCLIEMTTPQVAGEFAKSTADVFCGHVSFRRELRVAAPPSGLNWMISGMAEP